MGEGAAGEGRGSRAHLGARAGLRKGLPDWYHEVPGSRPVQSGPGRRARGVVTERIGGNCCQWGEAGPEAERRVCAVPVDLAGPGSPRPPGGCREASAPSSAAARASPARPAPWTENLTQTMFVAVGVFGPILWGKLLRPVLWRPPSC